VTPEKPYREFSASVFERNAQNPPSPVKAQFEITYRCNLHCVHCYTDPFNTPAALRKELSYTEVLEILDQLREAGVLWLSLTGGEAMVHPRFRDIYLAATSRGFVVSLLSNATVVTDATADFLAEHPPFQLDVSVHGAAAPVYDAITGVSGAHRYFLNGLRRLLERKLPVQLKTNAMTLNRHELETLRRFVEGFGLDFNLNTILYPRLNGDLSSTQYRLSPKEVVELETGKLVAENKTTAFSTVRNGEKISSVAPAAAGRGPAVDDRQRGPGLRIAGPTNFLPFNAGAEDDDCSLFRCGCGTSSVTISPYGLLRACTFTIEPRFDLRAMHVRDAFVRLAAEIRSSRYTTNSLCRRCPVSSYCDKNPVMAQAEAGSKEAPIPYFCEVATLRHDLSV
jgi:radical SAM protein with 4Fe4S-binding SPASM domain